MKVKTMLVQTLRLMSEFFVRYPLLNFAIIFTLFLIFSLSAHQMIMNYRFLHPDMAPMHDESALGVAFIINVLWKFLDSMLDYALYAAFYFILGLLMIVMMLWYSIMARRQFDLLLQGQIDDSEIANPTRLDCGVFLLTFIGFVAALIRWMDVSLLPLLFLSVLLVPMLSLFMAIRAASRLGWITSFGKTMQCLSGYTHHFRYVLLIWVLVATVFLLEYSLFKYFLNALFNMPVSVTEMVLIPATLCFFFCFLFFVSAVVVAIRFSIYEGMNLEAVLAQQPKKIIQQGSWNE